MDIYFILKSGKRVNIITDYKKITKDEAIEIYQLTKIGIKQLIEHPVEVEYLVEGGIFNSK